MIDRMPAMPDSQRGRPRKGRDARLHIRMRPATKDALLDYCEQHEIPLSDVLEHWITRALSEAAHADDDQEVLPKSA